MAINRFASVPIYGPSDETVKINSENIIDVRVINTGSKDGQAETWYVQVNMLAGKYYLLRTEGAPYETKEEALVIRDQFIDSII
jgi:hypothetical protein